jgi:hypothetical protein
MDSTRREELRQGNPRAGTFHAVFRMLAIADLYGPERAIEWAQTLLDDPELLAAFATLPTRPAAEITVRRLAGPSAASPNWN